jgi:hypothetical protein
LTDRQGSLRRSSGAVSCFSTPGKNRKRDCPKSKLCHGEIETICSIMQYEMAKYAHKYAAEFFEICTRIFINPKYASKYIE